MCKIIGKALIVFSIQATALLVLTDNVTRTVEFLIGKEGQRTVEHTETDPNWTFIAPLLGCLVMGIIFLIATLKRRSPVRFWDMPDLEE